MLYILIFFYCIILTYTVQYFHRRGAIFSVVHDVLCTSIVQKDTFKMYLCLFLCRVMKVAKGFLDQGQKLSFAVASKNSFSHDISEMGIDASSGELPVVGIRTATGDKYVMQEEFT